jgi:hypothetical protein
MSQVLLLGDVDTGKEPSYLHGAYHFKEDAMNICFESTPQQLIIAYG